MSTSATARNSVRVAVRESANSVYALFQAAALQDHHRNQYGRQGHPDTSYGDRLGLTGVTISDLA